MSCGCGARKAVTSVESLQSSGTIDQQTVSAVTPKPAPQPVEPAK